MTSIFVNKAENVTITGFGDNATAVTAQGSIGYDTSAFGWTYSIPTAGLGSFNYRINSEIN